jgi:signal transduction histidine kinase
MRLFAKYFLCATLVMSIALLFSGYLFITSSHESAVRREVERALEQYQYDKFMVQAHLIANEIKWQDEVSYDLFNGLSADLSGYAAFFAEDQSLLYSALPSQVDFKMLDAIPDHAIVHQMQNINGNNYLLVCGKIAHGNITMYMLVATDISSVVTQKEQMKRSFITIYFITLGISMAFISLLSMLLTRSIDRMTKAANRIAHGHYHERLSVASSDEIGALSESFNKMTDAIEEKICELSEHARQKEDFAASFAHELKTPLTSVIGYADMLYQKNLDRQQVRDAAGYILSEGMRLEALSLKLMDLIVLNKQDFTLEEMHLDALLSNIANGLAPILTRQQVTLRLNAAPVYVKVDYDLIKTLLLNLIDNAIKAGCDTIEISGEPSGDVYRIRVSDNGRGIPEAELNRITEAFYTVDKSRSRRQHGVGLGLTLAARIAAIHGSSLAFDSREGVGTVVSIDFIRGGGADGE